MPYANRERKNAYYREYRQKNKARYYKYSLNYKRRALQKISGSDNPKCVHCGCDDVRLLEVNHRNGGGNKERIQYLGKGIVKIRRGTIYPDVLLNRRGVDDLDVVCRVCNAWDFLRRRFGADVANRLQIKWA